MELSEFHKLMVANGVDYNVKIHVDHYEIIALWDDKWFLSNLWGTISGERITIKCDRVPTYPGEGERGLAEIAARIIDLKGGYRDIRRYASESSP